MALLDLANELLRRVTDFVHPLDLMNFVLTCTHIHKIAAQRLEQHRALRDKYSKIKVVAEEAEGYWFDHPVDAIYDIEKDPWLAEYVRQVSFIPADSSECSPEDDWVNGCHFSAGTRSKLARLTPTPINLVTCIGLTAKEKIEWRDEIEKGNHSATFAVLLTLLPNLRRLILGGGQCQYKAYLDKLFQHTSSSHCKCSCLSSVNTIEVRDWFDQEFYADPNALNEMVFLPSLRKLQIDRFNDWDLYRYECLSSKPGVLRYTSNIEHLVIGKCGQDLDNLANLSQPMGKLKRLDFESTLGPYYSNRYGRMEEIEHRTQFELGVMSLIAERDFEWKIDIIPKDLWGDIKCTVRIRALEFAHELEETREREQDQQQPVSQ